METILYGKECAIRNNIIDYVKEAYPNKNILNVPTEQTKEAGKKIFIACKLQKTRVDTLIGMIILTIIAIILFFVMSDKKYWIIGIYSAITILAVINYFVIAKIQYDSAYDTYLLDTENKINGIRGVIAKDIAGKSEAIRNIENELTAKWEPPPTQVSQSSINGFLRRR